MIKNLWQNTTFICMNHDGQTNIVLEPTVGKKELFYACPKYKSENRETGERGCRNNIYSNYAQEAIEHVSQKIEEYESKNISADCITGYKWTKRDIDFEVLYYLYGSLKIGVLNRKELAKTK